MMGRFWTKISCSKASDFVLDKLWYVAATGFIIHFFCWVKKILRGI